MTGRGSVVVWGWGEVKEITKGQEETFESDGCVYHLDCVMVS